MLGLVFWTLMEGWKWWEEVFFLSFKDFLNFLLTGELFDAVADGGETSPSYDAVRKTFAGLADDSEKNWMKLLRDGFWKKSTYAATRPKGGGAISVTVPKAPSAGNYEVVFTTDGSVYDRCHCNFESEHPC